MVLSVFKKEFRYFFSTPTGYIVLGLFWLAISLFLWVIPGQYNIMDSGYAQLDGLFQLSPWLFMFLCPAVCMRMFAEEMQNHTWELLATKPISCTQIVLGKFLAAWVLTIIALLPCIFHYHMVWALAEPVGNIDSGAFRGAFIGLIFLTAANCSIGLFTSSLTQSQIVAFILGLLLCFLLFYGFDLASELFTNGKTVQTIQQAGFHAHYKSISRGVIDSKDITYFLSVTAIFILITIKKMSARK